MNGKDASLIGLVIGLLLGFLLGLIGLLVAVVLGIVIAMACCAENERSLPIAYTFVGGLAGVILAVVFTVSLFA